MTKKTVKKKCPCEVAAETYCKDVETLRKDVEKFTAQINGRKYDSYVQDFGFGCEILFNQRKLDAEKEEYQRLLRRIYDFGLDFEIPLPDPSNSEAVEIAQHIVRLEGKIRKLKESNAKLRERTLLDYIFNTRG